MKKKFFFSTLFLFNFLSLTAQFTTNPWNWGGGSNPQWNDYSPTIYRSGSLSIQGEWGAIPEQRGFLFYQEGGGNHWEHGGFPVYGLSLGKFNGANFSLSETDTWSNRSLILSGWGGLGLRTMSGAILMHQNGIISMGLSQGWRDQAKIRELSQKTSDFVSGTGGYTLYVRNGIVSDKMKVTTVEKLPDYVFKKGYPLLTLSQVDTFIRAKGHLPNTPSAEVIESQGLELGTTAKNHQEKIEEVFLHLIELEKRIKSLEAENASLKAQLQFLQK